MGHPKPPPPLQRVWFAPGRAARCAPWRCAGVSPVPRLSRVRSDRPGPIHGSDKCPPEPPQASPWASEPTAPPCFESRLSLMCSVLRVLPDILMYPHLCIPDFFQKFYLFLSSCSLILNLNFEVLMPMEISPFFFLLLPVLSILPRASPSLQKETKHTDFCYALVLFHHLFIPFLPGFPFPCSGHTYTFSAQAHVCLYVQ